MQDDLVHVLLTVRETLNYYAELRMDVSCSQDERNNRINEVIELMGLCDCEHTIVGDTRRKGLSGGERKRLCIAMEILSR